MKVQLESNLSELARARRLVREAAGALRGRELSPESIDQLELAITEAVANVIRHSYRGEPGHRFDYLIEASADALEVIIRHDGASFDPASVPEPAFDGTSECGFGLFIISKCVDIFDYSTDKQNGSTIRLIKKINKKKVSNEVKK